MQHFCYPEEDHELLNHEYVRDFLRNPSDFPKNVDLNYLRNQRDAVNYTTINTFKGLEADIVFIVDTDKIPLKQKHEKLYTEASRARHKLYVLSV